MKKLVSSILALSMVLSLSAGMTLTVGADTPEDGSDGEDAVTLLDIMSDQAGSSAEDTLNELYSNFQSGFNEDGSADSSIYDYAEDNVYESLNTLSDDDFDSAFDLRHVGGTVTYNAESKQNDITGGLSYVTPVKFQNPWGTCWAFGIIAASETSILYEEGLGTESVKNENIDLSEHHLAWFAKNHIPAEGEEGYGVNYVNNQDGEGMYFTSGISNNSMEDGYPFYGTSVFAAGTGVVTEEFSPYCGAEKKILVARKSTADKEKYTVATITYDSIEAWEAETDEGIKENYRPVCYSEEDDWSLDESMRFYQSYALEESNVLPYSRPTVDEKTGETVLDEDGINAIKSELMQGRAVEVAYHADGHTPSSDPTVSQSRYINSNYAQYTWDTKSATHSVCIVGWDDDYDASNFGQTNAVKYDSKSRIIYKLKDSNQRLTYASDGTLYYEDEDGVKHEYKSDSDKIEPVTEDTSSVSVPAGNGAWIVKNSWGADDNEFPNKLKYGIDGTGYFYLSYYDPSISFLETYDFVVTDEEEEEYDYSLVDQYDYMPSYSVSKTTAYSPVLMANVFTATEDMEIEAVSCETATPGTSVRYGICLLDDGEDYPTGDSELIMNAETEVYEYGGYHREELDNPVTVAEGEKYAVVVMEYYSTESTDKFYITSNSAYSKDYAELLDLNSYSVGVINPGESYILTQGYNSEDIVSIDYYDYLTEVRATSYTSDYYQYDNFSIKAYGKPTTKAAPQLYAAGNTKDGIEVSWEDKGEGTNYRIFSRVSGTTQWTAAGDTTETSITVTGLQSGTSYDFTVACIDEDGMEIIGEYDACGISCTYLSCVDPEASKSQNSVMLTWDSVDGAEGYNIYRKELLNDYELIGTIYRNSDLSYIDTNAQEAVIYEYQVRAFAGYDESASETEIFILISAGWYKDGDTWYYRKIDGTTAKEQWVWYKSAWYYMNADGAMASSQWVWYNNSWYYMNANGTMAHSQWVWYKNAWYYMNSNGKMASSQWIWYKNAWYYMAADGKMVTGSYTINGRVSNFADSGKWTGYAE